MAGAKLVFSNGYMGFERCIEPATNKQYLRAVVYSKSRGLQTSAAVEPELVAAFLLESVRQLAYSLGFTDERMQDMMMEELIKEINAEIGLSARH